MLFEFITEVGVILLCLLVLMIAVCAIDFEWFLLYLGFDV